MMGGELTAVPAGKSVKVSGVLYAPAGGCNIEVLGHFPPSEALRIAEKMRLAAIAARGNASGRDDGL